MRGAVAGLAVPGCGDAPAAAMSTPGPVAAGMGSVSVVIVGSSGPCRDSRVAHAGVGSAGDRLETERPFLPEGPRREVPYRAGEPARNWHLAGVAAGRLSWLQRAGPSATLDKSYSVAADGRRRRSRLSTASRRDERP